MNLSELLQPLNILLLHGPELSRAGIDPQNFLQAVANLPHCRVLSMDTARPTSEQADQVRGFLGQTSDLHPVLLVAQDPELRGADIARLLLGEFQINPEQLLPVDLTPALEQPDPDRRAAKGMDIIRQAAVRASLSQPIASRTISVSRQVLVWGDSGAALQTALNLANGGYQVLLANPKAEFQPIPWEYEAEPVESQVHTRLRQQVQEHAGIQIHHGARLRDVQGVAGNFTVRLDTPAACLTAPVGAIILSPELHEKTDLQAYGIPAHPQVISLAALERKLATEAVRPESVAILLGLAWESHPLALERALRAAATLLAAGSQVSLLMSMAKVAGPNLQKLIKENHDAGLLTMKLEEAPEIEPREGRLQVTFLEPSVRERLSLAVDLLVYDECYQAAPENVALAELLRLPLGPANYLQTGNVHQQPVATPRRGIYVIGPGRGIMGREETLADVAAALKETRDLLGQGELVAPLGRATVDRGKCVFCLTCYRMCPHGAITWDNRAIINEAACQGCGICASACPQDAIQVLNYSDQQIGTLLASLDSAISPRVVAFLCRNSAWEAYENAVKLHDAALPLGLTPIKVPCAGKVDPNYLLQAFNAGAAGVMVMGCPKDNCKSQHGNLCAQWAVEQVQGMLAEAGIEPERLLYQSLAANAPGDFVAAVDTLMANLQRLAVPASEDYPILLTTGAAYRQHRTVPRTYTYHFEAKSDPEVIIEISPADAQRLGIRSGERLQTKSPEGLLTATAMVSDRLRPGTAFLPRHFLKDAINVLLQGAPVPAGGFQSSEGLAVQLEKLVEQLEEVFGIKVPTSRFLHQGHTWVLRENGGRVRI
ncbi:MAG: hydrogenase iron-sulfur subunit, partial [Desulfobacca sp.]|uniref:hydrogenase iron-sulfur subunit n=1 Tax=Desulfobacca sp. TaxID=2067990 RepID=UPI00404AC1B9